LGCNEIIDVVRAENEEGCENRDEKEFLMLQRKRAATKKSPNLFQ
jgi:hypothetical protein